MNTAGFEFDEKTANAIELLESGEKIPHAIIIECDDKKKSLDVAKYLSMYVVCTAEKKPCGVCSQCHKAKEAGHADIYYAYSEGKSGRYSINQLRDIIDDAYIRPNEAEAKVYIFAEADNRLDVVQQNAILKLIEEPPQNLLFILLCENSKKLLKTIRSRCTVLRLSSDKSFDEQAVQWAISIVNGILSPSEYDLLKAINVLSDKDRADEVLQCVSLILRDGLVMLAGGNSIFDKELGRKLGTHFTKDKLIKMIALTDDVKIKITQNINMNLLTTWLCGEYRRISWLR